MKGKICSLSAASFLLLAAVGFVHAQTTDSVSCDPMPVDKKGAPNYLKYTVNYAASQPDPNASAGIPDEPRFTETAIHIINTKNPPKPPHVHASAECIYVLFKDKEGATIGKAQGLVPEGGSRVFATAQQMPIMSPPPFTVDYPAMAVDSAGGPIPMSAPFEGRAEIYSKNSGLQVSAFLTSTQAITDIPVQKQKQATKGGH